MKSKRPLDERENKDRKKAFAKTKMTVKAVAKDTNKTRRKRVKPTTKKGDSWNEIQSKNK